MAYNFGSDTWATEVAEISTRPEYQESRIRIFRKISDGEYNLDTGKWDGLVVESVYEGQARVINVRWSLYKQAAAKMNSSAEQSVRVQIPKDAVGRVLTGWTIEILDAPGNPALNGLVVTIQSDFQGASSAARTFECSIDGDFGGMDD